MCHFGRINRSWVLTHRSGERFSGFVLFNELVYLSHHRYQDSVPCAKCKYTSGMTPTNNPALNEVYARYWDIVKWPSHLWCVLFKSPQVQQKSKWIWKQTDRGEKRSCNSLFNVEEQIFAWTCTWPVCSAEEQPVLYPIRYYSFISRELFIKTYGLCNPSSFQHPDILVPSTDSQCVFVTHLGLWSWSLQPSALRLLFSYYDFLPRPTKVSVLFFFFGKSS